MAAIRIFIILISQVAVLAVRAQNLVPNNSFETNTANPNNYGDWFKCTSWSNVNGFQGSGYASPDYMTTSGSNGVDLPYTTFGTVDANTGSAIMGFATYSPYVVNFREYLSIQLSSPMQVGVAYEVSFYWTNGTNCYGGSSTDHVAIDFSAAPLTQSTWEPISVTPELDITTELWSSTWQIQSFIYTPTTAYTYFTIGNFKDDAATSHTMHTGFTTTAYYFIDDIVVQPAVVLPIVLSSFSGFSSAEGNVLEWVTASEHNNAYFSVEKMRDDGTFEEIGKLDGAGESAFSTSYSFTDDQVLRTTEYYRLKQVNTDATYTYSPVININAVLADEVKLLTGEPGGHYSIECNADQSRLFSYAIYNAGGQQVLRSPVKNLQQHFIEPVSLEGYAGGTYLLEIFLGDTRRTFKVINQ
ncbi:MAG: hypothetical protein ABIQ74_00250 [Chitinophagales bacterium]